MKNLKKFENFVNENLSQDDLNAILDKIIKVGYDKLSNHDKTLLKSFSDENIDVEEELRKYQDKLRKGNKFNLLKTSDPELEENIGRYVRKKFDGSNGLLAKYGIIYTIVGVQWHWGYVNGKYVPDKIGYRLNEIGKENDFGCVGDVDTIEFVDNISEEDAIKHNIETHKKIDKHFK